MLGPPQARLGTLRNIPALTGQAIETAPDPALDVSLRRRPDDVHVVSLGDPSQLVVGHVSPR